MDLVECLPVLLGDPRPLGRILVDPGVTSLRLGDLVAQSHRPLAPLMSERHGSVLRLLLEPLGRHLERKGYGGQTVLPGAYEPALDPGDRDRAPLPVFGPLGQLFLSHRRRLGLAVLVDYETQCLCAEIAHLYGPFPSVAVAVPGGSSFADQGPA